MNTLKLEKRDTTTKALDIRRQNLTPGVVYGNGIKSLIVQIPTTHLERCLSQKGEIYKIKTEHGNSFVKFDEVQKDAMNSKVLHFSLVSLKKGERAQVDIPLVIKGEPAGVKLGGNLIELQSSLKIVGKPSEFPDTIEVDVSHLELGENTTVADLDLPKKFDINENAETVLAVCTSPVIEDEVLEEEVNLSAHLEAV